MEDRAIFTIDTLPNGLCACRSGRQLGEICPDCGQAGQWPEFTSRDGKRIIRAMPVHGIFGAKHEDGTVAFCDEGYGFLTLTPDGHPDLIPLSDFQAAYVGADHVVPVVFEQG